MGKESIVSNNCSKTRLVGFGEQKNMKMACEQ